MWRLLSDFSLLTWLHLRTTKLSRIVSPTLLPLPNVETSLPPEVLFLLRQRRPAALRDLARLTKRADWKARALAVSALGLIARDDPLGRLTKPISRFLRPFPWPRKLIPPTGYSGRFARRPVADRIRDGSWFVRTGAALALGEIRDPHTEPSLRAALQDPMRPVRIAAAAALLAMGMELDRTASEVLNGAECAPPRLDGSSSTADWLEYLIRPHLSVLVLWLKVLGAGPAPKSIDPASWARLLAGDPRKDDEGTIEAEIQRYADETDVSYNLTKPFNRMDPQKNSRLLHTFLVLAEHMKIPTDALVLDLGGGSAWVSELLSKLGYCPITFDVAEPLLRLGRRRFEREGLRYLGAAGDMTRLPFRSGSFDAIIVIDALHHVPDLESVFHEAYRALTAGGLFLIAEPGEGHSETAVSLSETREHGIAEGEIHVADVVRLARRVGFDKIRIIPHFVPVVTMTPDGLESAAHAPSESWQVEIDGRPALFDEFLLRSIYTHPTVVLRKGERVIDSRLPRRLTCEIFPRLNRVGARVAGTVTLCNTGDTLWLSRAKNAGWVRLGVQLMDPHRRLLSRDYCRADLPTDVGPGSRVEIRVEVVLPDEQTPYVLKLDLVDELVCWFEERGSKPVYVAL